jgi:hypothetical protein
MSQVKVLKLRVTDSGRKRSRYLYEVIENGEVLCKRNSNRLYEACFVIENRNELGASIKYTYDCPYFFGRLDLIGKGDSSQCTPYALAMTEPELFSQLPGSFVKYTGVDGFGLTIIGI